MSMVTSTATNEVNAASYQNTAASEGSAQIFGKNQLDMKAFLTMFITQLQYQDPTNPMQSYELASQLAQFSSVEQLNQANSNLVKLQSAVAAQSNAQMIQLIGKQVIGQANTLQVASGKATAAEYQVETPGNVTIKIYDQNQNLVRTMSVGTQSAGKYSVAWDARDDSGAQVGDGNYRAKIEAVDGNGNALDVATTVSGTVYSYRLEQGTPYLILNGPDGIRLPISDIIGVMAS